MLSENDVVFRQGAPLCITQEAQLMLTNPRDASEVIQGHQSWYNLIC